MNIGIFDSGIGGLTTLKEIRKYLPNEDIIYYADSKNNPFGEKSYKELNIISHNIVNKLLKYNVKLIVIACNTVTTKLIRTLRKDYPNIIFVGTEPAIKKSCDENYKNILLLGTKVTINSKRTNELIKNNIKDFQKIYKVSCIGLADNIEVNNENKIDSLLNKYLFKYKDKNIDSIVLGCTHYPLIKNKIQKIFSNAKIIDGNEGVAKRVKYLLESNNLLSSKNKKGRLIFIQTKKGKN